MERERRASVEIAGDNAHLFEVGKTLTVEAAWKCGVAATAQWVVQDVHPTEDDGVDVCFVYLRRMTTD